MSAAAEIVPLTVADAHDLGILLRSANPEYVRHFHPMAFDTDSIRQRLAAARKDRWWALRSEGCLAGFFFLRGFDEGYERPSFGLFVAEACKGQGLGKMATAYALEWCRRHQVPRVMLKVHPENESAQAIYASAGFAAVGVCPKTGHTMMEVSLALEGAIDPET